jgi:hypothetical protein
VTCEMTSHGCLTRARALARSRSHVLSAYLPVLMNTAQPTWNPQRSAAWLLRFAPCLYGMVLLVRRVSGLGEVGMEGRISVMKLGETAADGAQLTTFEPTGKHATRPLSLSHQRTRIVSARSETS